MFRLTRYRFAADPFKVLGLTRRATKAEVKAAFRDLAKRHHPDNQSGSSDTKMMEEINRAYNLLLKEGGYERLHLSSSNRPDQAGQSHATKSQGLRRSSQPYDRRSVDDDAAASRIASLNPETERVTDEGKYMYQNRDTGEWITLDTPLVRPTQVRYDAFTREASDELFREIRDFMAAREERLKKMTQFEKVQERFADGGNLPSRKKSVLFVSVLLALAGCYIIYFRVFANKVFRAEKMEWYGDARVRRQTFDDLYGQS